MKRNQKMAMNELRKAYSFYKICKKDRTCRGTGALSDAREYLFESLDELMRITGKYKIDSNTEEPTDTVRLDWLLSNGMDQLSKDVMFGSNTDSSNYRAQIDVLMEAESEAMKD